MSQADSTTNQPTPTDLCKTDWGHNFLPLLKLEIIIDTGTPHRSRQSYPTAKVLWQPFVLEFFSFSSFFSFCWQPILLYPFSVIVNIVQASITWCSFPPFTHLYTAASVTVFMPTVTNQLSNASNACFNELNLMNNVMYNMFFFTLIDVVHTGVWLLF